MTSKESEGAIHAKLKEWQREVSALLDDHAFTGQPTYLNHPAAYALEARGKMLRPALCLAATEAVGGDWHSALSGAAALEVFHTFTLVHDDIMDADDLRRGQPTVHRRFDLNQALLAGDALMIHAYGLLGAVPAKHLVATLKIFNKGALAVCQGQAWDMQFEASGPVELDAYVHMIDQKTGALLCLACGLGAILGDGSAEQIAALQKYGLLLGRVFQVQDDLLEMTSDPKIMGKSLGSDLENQKKTWLWLDFQKHATEEELAAWRDLLRSRQSSETRRQGVMLLLDRAGSLGRARDQISKWTGQTRQILQAADLPSPRPLEYLTERILSRQK